MTHQDRSGASGVRVLTVARIRAVESRAIRDHGMSALVLMENAGTAAARVACVSLRRWGLRRALVLCGRGNNGGDGWVVARHLANAGVLVLAMTPGSATAMAGEGEAGANLVAALGADVPVRFEASPEEVAAELGAWDLVVDALLGTGLGGPVRSPLDRWIEVINSGRARVVSLDVPSGLDADSGEVMGAAVRADATVTFLSAKPGFFREAGPALIGKLYVAPISVPRRLYAQ